MIDYCLLILHLSTSSGALGLVALLPTILRWNEEYSNVIADLNKESVITHRDMNSQNILWDVENRPYIIDWESAGLMNPMVEVIGYGLEWRV